MIGPNLQALFSWIALNDKPLHNALAVSQSMREALDLLNDAAGLEIGGNEDIEQSCPKILAALQAKKAGAA